MNLMTIPGTRTEMTSVEYWIGKLDNPDQIILEQHEIVEYNKLIQNSIASMTDIFDIDEVISGEDLLNLIQMYKLPSRIMYDINGKEIEPADKCYVEIERNCDIENIKQYNKITFGIAVTNTRLRSFPTEMAIFKEQGDIEFDRFQETECQALEPVAILHKSNDLKWAFVKMYNYTGWARLLDIAVAADKQEILQYVRTTDFIVVTGNKITTQFNHYDQRVSKKDFYMGTKIPLVENPHSLSDVDKQGLAGNYAVRIAVRNEQGAVAFKTAIVTSYEDVSIGYLSYTRRNLLKQAFKLMGDRYDWGNKNCGRDCSSFIMYIYKVFGLKLPRNADEQERVPGKSVKFLNEDVENREKTFESVKPGAAIFMQGHVMMYIGDEQGEKFMIHDFHAFSQRMEQGTKKIFNNQVAVTSTLLPTADQYSVKYIDKFSSLLLFEYMK